MGLHRGPILSRRTLCDICSQVCVSLFIKRVCYYISCVVLGYSRLNAPYSFGRKVTFTAPAAEATFGANDNALIQWTTTLPAGTTIYVGLYEVEFLYQFRKKRTTDECLQGTPIYRLSLGSEQTFTVGSSGSGVASFPLQGGSVWPIYAAVGYDCYIAGFVCTWEYSKPFYAPQTFSYGVNYNESTQSRIEEYEVWNKDCSSCSEGDTSTFCTLCDGVLSLIS